ncbi:MAG: hypothetical protein AAGB31_04365, partial [Bdellovibrio sp.]
MRNMKFFSVILAATLLYLQAEAQVAETPVAFTFQGRIFKANGVDPVEDAAVTFNVQIRSADGLCR